MGRHHLMRQAHHMLEISCQGRGLYDISREVDDWVNKAGIHTGVLTLFVQHTSCSLLVQENADPAVQHDMERFLSKLVPDGDPMFRHSSEGPDDMSAHVRSALTHVSLNVPVSQGRMGLGVWQGVYLYEHRTHHMRRRVSLHLIGE